MLLRTPWRQVTALAAGALWGLCFATWQTAWLPWVALAPLFWLLSQPRPGRLGFLHGLAAWSVGIYWIAPTIVVYGDIPWWLALPLLELLCAFLALYHLAFATLGAPLWRAAGWPRWLGLPALWVALEWLRGWFLSGFPWNLAAYAWTEMAGALPLAAWIGAYGVSFLLVAVNLGVALAAWRRRLAPALASVLAGLLVLALAARWAVPPAAPRTPEIARIIQPNTPNQVLFRMEQALVDYQRLLAMSQAACREGPGLLLWPESAAFPFSLDGDPWLAADVEKLAADGCPVLLNSPSSAGGRDFNSAFLVRGGVGEVARYDKRHLVPFGEYVPMKKLLPFVGKLARNAGDFTPAASLSLLPWGAERLGPAICYEVTFPEEVAAMTRHGATVLVSLTNDAWYGDTSAPWQHLRAAQFRAAENRRPLLRAAVTGVSASIAPDGALLAQMGVGARGVLTVAVAGRDDRSPYSRAPWLPPAACALAGAAAIAAISFRRRKDAAR